MDSTYMPSDIIFNILYRLPVKTIIICKCVCKSWLEMLETPEFAKHHLSVSTSASGLIICDDPGSRFPSTHPDEIRLSFNIWEFVDEIELEKHELQYNLVTKLSRGGFNNPLHYSGIKMHDSVNGLLLLTQKHDKPYDLVHVCNPITREYIELSQPEMDCTSSIVTYGIGVSKTSGQYKVVSILKEYGPQTYGLFPNITNTVCKVYTLGTKSWRSVAPAPGSSYHDIHGSFYHDIHSTNGAFFNGNLHWLEEDENKSLWISCFDLETELFNIFPRPIGLSGITPMEIKLVVLSEDYLHLCYNSREKIYIWVMTEYGVNKSWRRIFRIKKRAYTVVDYDFVFVYPIKIFKNGDMLMCWNDCVDYFCFYSNKSKSLEKFNFPDYGTLAGIRLHVSSFVSLKCFAMETVSKF